MPLTRRVPKYGFTPRNKVEMQIVNVETLGKLAENKKVSDGRFNPDILFKVGATSKKNIPVKILGEGELKMKLDVTAHAFSKSAIAKIEAAGGKISVLNKATANS